MFITAVTVNMMHHEQAVYKIEIHYSPHRLNTHNVHGITMQIDDTQPAHHSHFIQDYSTLTWHSWCTDNHHYLLHLNIGPLPSSLLRLKKFVVYTFSLQKFVMSAFRLYKCFVVCAF